MAVSVSRKKYIYFSEKAFTAETLELAGISLLRGESKRDSVRPGPSAGSKRKRGRLDVDDRLTEALAALEADASLVKSISAFNWIINPFLLAR